MEKHLTRELALIEERLSRHAGTESGAAAVVLYQRFLRSATHRLRLNHRNGAGGRMIARERCLMVDALLKHLFEGETEGKGAGALPPVALVALGGYGRGELNPFSDIDVMFLHGKAGASGTKSIHSAVQRLLYPLWDMGLKVGHSTRTVEEALAQANGDMQSKTALLESRFLCGDETLFKRLEQKFEPECIDGREEEYIAWRLKDQAERHAKEGGSVFLQEPNIKQSCGGLRDYHSLLWVAYCWKRVRKTQELCEEGVLAREERKQIERAYDFLMRVRNEAHFLSERPNDQLTLSLQGRVASGLDYPQRTPVKRVEAFMRDYYKAAQDVFFLTNAVAARMAASRKGRKGLLSRLLPAKSSRVENVDGFLVRDGTIDIEPNSSVFTADPSRILKVFLLAQQRNLDISFDLQRRIRRRLKLVDWKFIRARKHNEVLLELLGAKGRVARVLRLMHRTDILGKMLPEFEPLTCLVQHEFFHRYTADEHTLVCLEQLDALVNVERLAGTTARYQVLMHEVEDPAILYLAMLLHDSGKGADTRDHSEVSATLCQQAGRRMRLGVDRIRMLTFLADHHLTMSQLAQRRNVEDPDTVREFAAIVENEMRLNYLMLITYADGRGTTGGNAWSDWKESLIWHLYEQTRLLLRDSPEFERLAAERGQKQRERILKIVAARVEKPEVRAHFALLPERYSQVVEDDVIARHIEGIHDFMVQQVRSNSNPLEPLLAWHHQPERGHSLLIVVTWDREQLFVKIAGAVSVAGLNILSADIFTRQDDIIVDTLRICTDRNEAVTDERDQKAVASVLMESLLDPAFDFAPLVEKARKRRRPSHWTSEGFPTRLRFDTRSLSEETLMEIQTPDRPALLHDLVQSLSRNGAQITFSRVETEKGAAVDAFYLVDRSGHKLSDPDQLEAIRTDVLKCVGAA